MRSESAVLSIGLVVLVSSAGAPAQVSFRGLGTLPPDMWTEVRAISPDGSVPAGRAFGKNESGMTEVHAVWWPDGIEIIEGDAPFFDGTARGVSALGGVVVGDGQLGIGGPGTVRRAFRSVGSRFEYLPGFDAAVHTYAEAVTPDGRTIVGSSGGTPCVWVGDESPAPLALPAGATSARAIGVSADGSRILGSFRASEVLGMTLWTDGAPAVIPLSDRPLLVLGAALSLDGRTVVGTFVEMGVGTPRSFTWTAQDGLVEIQDTFGLYAVSADGSVIGGSGRYPNSAATLWIDGDKINVEELLASSGIDLTDWSLSSVAAVSADGRTIAGNGVYRYGDGPGDFRSEGWIAVIPTPSTGALIMASVLCVRRRRRAINSGA
jgi:uncharacterized membrane protein